MNDLMEIGSLDELAVMFEGRARAARDLIKPTTPNMRVALLREQARTWENAAETVRRTIMRPVTSMRPTAQPRRARVAASEASMTLTECYDKFGVVVNNPRNAPWSAISDDGAVVVTLWSDEFLDVARNEYSNFNRSNLSEWKDKPKNKRRIKHLRHARDKQADIFQSIIVTPKDSRRNSIMKCEPGPKMRLIELNEQTGEFSAQRAGK